MHDKCSLVHCQFTAHTSQLTYAINNSIYFSFYLPPYEAKNNQNLQGRLHLLSYSLCLPVQLFVVVNVFHLVQPLCCHSSIYTCFPFFSAIHSMSTGLTFSLFTVTVNATRKCTCIYSDDSFSLFASSFYFSCYLTTLQDAALNYIAF